jgi:hypothetical protein
MIQVKKHQYINNKINKHKQQQIKHMYCINTMLWQIILKWTIPTSAREMFPPQPDI